MIFSPSTNQEHLQAITKETTASTPETVSIDDILLEDDDLLESLISLPAGMDFNHPDPVLNSMLFMVASNNRIKAASYLLCERRVNPNTQEVELSTPLHMAIQTRNLTIAKMLINRSDIDLTLKNVYEETVLVKAIDIKSMEIMQLLIDKAPSLVNTATQDNLMPIDLALTQKSGPMIQLLLDNGATVNKNTCDIAMKLILNESTERETSRLHFFDKSISSNKALSDNAKLVLEHYRQQNLAANLGAASL